MIDLIDDRPRKKSCGWCDDYGLVERMPLLTIKINRAKSISIIGTDCGELLLTEPWVAMAMMRSEYIQRFQQDCPTCQVLHIETVGEQRSSIDVMLRPSLSIGPRKEPLDGSKLESETIELKHNTFTLSEEFIVKTLLGYGPRSKTWAVGPVQLYGKEQGKPWTLLSDDVRS